MSKKQRLSGRLLPFSQIWRRTALAICLPFLGAGSVTPILPAAAQSEAPPPSIEVATEITVAPAVRTPLRFSVSGAGAISHQAMMLVRGLPPGVTLSEGRSFSAGVWVVPLANLGRIEIAPAAGTSGKSEITLELITLDGKVLAEAKSTLRIAPAAAAPRKIPRDTARSDTVAPATGPLAGKPQVTGTAGQSPANAGAIATQLTPEQVDRARKLMERGDAQMEAGKIASARLLYRSAAESGWAAGALALAATYDSTELLRSKVIGGIQPDFALAKKWYEKAKQLGSTEAERHLRQLSTR